MSSTHGPGMTWVKSSYSDGQGGDCVEWSPASATLNAVPVRDSKRPNGPQLAPSSAAWQSFVDSLKN
ncbi:DUF397 domain-containing protein [Streptomyces sp. BPTC-684]|uniref:DUF397 domain-containing protein n=1 Tax=Streptomyces sp. BPTC-684 TaxID=3043734 RepID=UPI0024B1D039|nr:DUF397 domain-containing protein [Streptomyces sp. BPTC-684]WHM38848.1 DUF397 domain-containing protein [Streptomyces sp. BPTC-684]